MNRKEKVINFTKALIDPNKAIRIVEPNGNSEGFWFGGGDMIEHNGALYVTGRFRDYGDSRTGTGSGKRGWKLSILKSEDKGKTFKEIKSFSKEELSNDIWTVLSIEGTGLTKTPTGVRMFVSIESSNIMYPDHIKEFQKPGTGRWLIFHLDAKHPEEFTTSKLVIDEKPQDDIRFLHSKDPSVYRSKLGNEDKIIYCTHPFNWTGTTSAFWNIDKNGDRSSESNYNVVQRGITWDVAVTRITSMIDLDIGIFKGTNTQLIFYDGAEGVRQVDEHNNAIKRHRGYSCEEISSVATTNNADFKTFERVELKKPLFTSPWGIGTLRYIHILETQDGFYATYQCSDKNKSQPLMLNFISKDDAEKLLS